MIKTVTRRECRGLDLFAVWGLEVDMLDGWGETVYEVVDRASSSRVWHVGYFVDGPTSDRLQEFHQLIEHSSEITQRTPLRLPLRYLVIDEKGESDVP